MSWTNTNADRPNWLSNDEEAPAAGSKDWDSPTAAADPSVEPSSTHLSQTDDVATDKTRRPLCANLSFSMISACFLAAFIYGAMTQDKVSNDIDWYIYFGISACIPAFFLAHYMCWFPPKMIYVLSLGMIVWSAYKIIRVSLKVGDEPKDTDKHDEYVEDLVKASVGCFSALYHGIVTGLGCGKKDKTED